MPNDGHFAQMFNLDQLYIIRLGISLFCPKNPVPLSDPMEVSGLDPRETFPWMTAFSPSPYALPNQVVHFVKCVLRDDVPVVIAPALDDRIQHTDQR
jgi:hypothetical protein